MNSAIFVFGSNLAGRHGAGAAKAALALGAVSGVGVGPTGWAYAIPTKDCNIKTLSLTVIARYVNQFREYTETMLVYGNVRFKITRIGCGLAGYQDHEIAPLFVNCPQTSCYFDSQWARWLGPNAHYWGTYS